MGQHILLAVHGGSGTEPVHVEALDRGRYRLLYSPGFVLGVAAGRHRLRSALRLSSTADVSLDRDRTPMEKRTERLVVTNVFACALTPRFAEKNRRFRTSKIDVEREGSTRRLL
jgi:hypothetical protein